MNSLATGKRKRETKRNGKKTVKHVRVSESSETSHVLLGMVRKEKIVQEVAMRSDVWSYLDDDFHVEISDELYHHCLALVCDKGTANTENFAWFPQGKLIKAALFDSLTDSGSKTMNICNFLPVLVT